MHFLMLDVFLMRVVGLTGLLELMVCRMVPCGNKPSKILTLWKPPPGRKTEKK